METTRGEKSLAIFQSAKSFEELKKSDKMLDERKEKI